MPAGCAGDCVAFFYKRQKLEEFAAVRRKQQLRKRRLQVRLLALHAQAGLCQAAGALGVSETLPLSVRTL